MHFEAALANRLGNRSCNQDRSRVVDRGHAVLLALADGMGGHARGELAAQALVDSVEASFREQPLPIAEPERFLEQAFLRAHADILATGLRQPEPVYPRTTAVVCLLQHNRAWWAHLGDSRLYWLRDGKVLGRTRDHTYVEELVRRRALREREAQSHPMRNYVTQCLGGPQEPRRPALGGAAELQIGDQILLCSDGFWGALSETALLQLGDGELDATLQELASEAERSTYPNSDNVSAVTLRLLAAQEVCLDSGDGVEQEPPEALDTDPLDHAIASIEAAIRHYRHELDE